MRKTLLSRTSVFTQQSGHPEQWLYKAAALLFLVAAGLQMLIGDKPASRVPLWLAAIATFGATVWLVVRRLREEATRRETEDKMVKDLQEYLTTPHTNDSHTSPEVAQAVCCQDLALETCDFQEFGPALQSEAPS